MTTKTTKIGFAILIGTVAVGNLLLRDQIGSQERAAIAGWAEGTSARYRLAWQMDTELAMPGQGNFIGHVDLGGTLQLVSHGERDGKTLIAASLASVDAHDVAVLGKPVFETAAAAQTALVGSTAWVELERDGSIASIAFDKAAPPAFKHLMQNVVGLATITPNTRDEWTAIEAGPSGIAEVRYERDGARLTRTRDRYQTLMVAPTIPNATPSLAAKAEIELDRSGRIATLVDDEELAISGAANERIYHGHSRFALTLEGTDVLASVPPRPVLASLEVRRPGVPTLEGDIERGHLEQRAGKLTFDGIVRGLRPWTDREAKREWLAQAVALLHLDSALCAELVEIGFAESSTDETRALVMDLLASTGHIAAQTAMRDALSRPSAQALQVELIQRFSSVLKPTPATAKFLLATHGTATGNLQIATAYTLGAVGDHLRGTDAALAREISNTLRDALVDATGDEQRAHLLAAIGNAASKEDAAVVIGYTSAENPDVRSRAAWALRDIDSDAARDALVSLVADDDPTVARAALSALDIQHLTPGDLDRLESSPPRSDAARAGLIDLLATHLQTGSPALRRMLETIATTTTDPNLQERARVVLAQLNS